MSKYCFYLVPTVSIFNPGALLQPTNLNPIMFCLLTIWKHLFFVTDLRVNFHSSNFGHGRAGVRFL